MPGFFISCTGYSLSEPVILTSTNPNYDDRLFFELRVQYKKVHYMLCASNCSECQNKWWASSSDSFTNIETTNLQFFCENQFVYLFLCTVNVSNNFQFCKFIVSKYSWDHMMSRSKNNLMFTTCTELVVVLYWTRNSKWTICCNILDYLITECFWQRITCKTNHMQRKWCQQ